MPTSGTPTDNPEAWTAVFDHLPFGVAVYGTTHNLERANETYRTMLDLPHPLAPIGVSLTTLLGIMINRGEFIGSVAEDLARQRLHEIMDGVATRIERARPNGRWIEGRFLSLPDGRSLHVYGDITDRIEQRWRSEGMILDLKTRMQELEMALATRPR